jgi:hypothetical protein
MNDSLAIPILVILIFVIEEVIPMLFVLDWSFMEIFVIHANVNNFAFLRGGNNPVGQRSGAAAATLDLIASYEI